MIAKREFFKIKVVLVLGYNGLGFHGMQKYLSSYLIVNNFF